jgi:hypothetical protein
MHAKEVKRSVDLKRAFHWYDKTVKNGCEVTQFNLGSFTNLEGMLIKMKIKRSNFIKIGREWMYRCKVSTWLLLRKWNRNRDR